MENEGLDSAFDGTIKVSKVGYPKFDDYFNHPSRDLSHSLLNPAMPTIVWLPTKAPLSSIRYWKAISIDKYINIEAASTGRFFY